MVARILNFVSARMRQKFLPGNRLSPKTGARIGLLSVLLASMCFGQSAGAAEGIPKELLAKNPALTNLSLSRDGDYMVGLITPPGNPNSEKQALAVWDPRNLSKPPTITLPDGNVEFTGAQALKAGKILVRARTKWTGGLGGCGEGKRIGSTKTYLDKIFITDTKFSKFSEPFAAKQRTAGKSGGSSSNVLEFCSQVLTTGGLVADLPLDEEWVIISQNNNLFGNSVNYLRYNLRTGEKEQLFKNSGGVDIGLINPYNGEILTKSDSKFNDGSYKFYTLFDNGTGDFEVHDKLTSDSSERHNVSIVGHIPSSTKFYVSTDQFSDKSEIYIYDSKTKAYESTPLFTNEQFEVGRVIQSTRKEDFGQVLGHTYSGASGKLVWSDPTLAAITEAFEKSYPGKDVNVEDWTHDRSTVIVSVQGGDMPPAYYLVIDGTETKLLGVSRPDLARTPMSPTELIYYESRDGKKIPGLLSLPVGWKKGDPPVPTVIHPHGGPWARDFAGWDASGWVPFLTSRGYAVLRPQYRGSTGWGRDIWLSGDAEWGQKMQDDKDDGAAWLVSQGYADEDKIAIFGYSYGGFAAFAAVVRPNSPYACAIGGAGVSDLTKLGRLWSDNRVQRLVQGKTVTGMDPMNNTDKANIPVLVFHGDRDVRVPLFHGKDFYKKVKNKVDAKLVVIKDQPHSLPWTPKMQEESLGAIEDFLETSCFN